MLHIFPLWITICITLINFFNILAVVELLIKTFYHYKNKNYSCNYKSVIITSPIGFDIVLTNDEATLKQRWCAVVSTLFRRCLNVVQRCFKVVWTSGTDVVSTLCNVGNQMSDFVSFSTSDQRYPQRWNNADPTLKCWLGSSHVL